MEVEEQTQTTDAANANN